MAHDLGEISAVGPCVSSRNKVPRLPVYSESVEIDFPRRIFPPTSSNSPFNNFYYTDAITIDAPFSGPVEDRTSMSSYLCVDNSVY